MIATPDGGDWGSGALGYTVIEREINRGASFPPTMLAHRVAATAASLMAATCVAAVVILAADGRPGTEEPLPATALAQEETARRLETAGLGGIFRCRSRSTAQREHPRQRTMDAAGLAVACSPERRPLPVSPGGAVGHTVPRLAGRRHGPRSVVIHAACVSCAQVPLVHGDGERAAAAGQAASRPGQALVHAGALRAADGGLVRGHAVHELGARGDRPRG